jgi:hypothetical protein
MSLHAPYFTVSVRTIVTYSSVSTSILSQNILSSHISRPVIELGTSDAEAAANLQTGTTAFGF